MKQKAKIYERGLPPSLAIEAVSEIPILRGVKDKLLNLVTATLHARGSNKWLD